MAYTRRDAYSRVGQFLIESEIQFGSEEVLSLLERVNLCLYTVRKLPRTVSLRRKVYLNMLRVTMAHWMIIIHK